MLKHLKMLDNLRVRMVQKRYPAKLINLISKIYLTGLNETRRKGAEK